MKSLISILSVMFVLLLVGCSNLEQETSPVAPEMNKMVSEQMAPSTTYPFLQCFNSVPVKSFNSTKSPGTVEVIIATDKFPKIFTHMFAVLEYEDFRAPISNNMIFIGKPLTNVFELEGVQTNYLKNIKVYSYAPDNNWKGITPPYAYMTTFSELKITEWSDTGVELVIHTDEWNSNISDSFIELQFANGDGSENVLTFIAKPSARKIAIPKFRRETITGLKMYAIFDNLSAN